jgi:hypothetical protein
MNFAVGSTVEQRYPGTTRDAARLAAVQRIAAFEAAGWAIADERWDGASTSGVADPVALPKYAAPGGTLVITFVAKQPADIPLTLGHLPVESEERSPLAGYLIRLVVILIVFAVALLIIISIGGPIISTLVNASPKPIGG